MSASQFGTCVMMVTSQDNATICTGKYSSRMFQSSWPRLIKGWPVGDSSFPISTILCVFGLSMGIEHIHPLYCCSLVLQSLDVWTHCWTSDYWLYKLGESSCWSLGMSHLCWHDGFLADRSQGSNSNSWCPKIVSLSLIDYYCRHY